MELLDAAKVSSNPVFLSLVLLSSLLIWLKLAKRKRLNLPPSPPKLPIIGNIHQVGKVPHQSLRDLSRKYGPLLLLHLGYNPTVLVSSPDIVKEIVKNHDIIFSNRPKTTALDYLYYGGRDMVFSPYGEYWKQVKKISVLELFSHRRVHSFQFVREEEVEVLVNKIRGACLKGEPVNLSERLMLVSSNIASRCILSHKSEDEDGCSRFGQLGKRLLILSSAFSIGDVFPYLGWLDVLTGYIPSMKALSAEFDAFLDQVIQEHRGLESDTDDEQVSNRKDFVSIIMRLQKDRMYDLDLTPDNIKGVLLDMFIGGTDTTKATIEWTMAELLKHPNAMNKVQEEVRNVVGNKSKVEMDDISRMGYLKCVIKETLRLHPPAPLLAPRRTSASVKLGGYHIPSDTTVLINGWAIHRDPECWEKPEEFIPERFENSSIDFQGQDFHYIPFGFGRRACPGMTFGIASAEYVMANLLYWFDWKLPAGEVAENMDMNEVYGITLHMKTPLRVVPVSHVPF
ncbi:cytochrome P450, family 71, subfamily A, polypeptide 22 [Hibiscus trionum]|uniref:Cytochrome P450, family 71, subfamily A, polypeptide 22 n=1 Tax=Hibiscus trionum TaxID=183268 RepID=A0A9W7LNV2_HIBTR|nr:cytochrome P450, family 71, subfamily A, polypeptide 22 [Hibiscus trionum]